MTQNHHISSQKLLATLEAGERSPGEVYWEAQGEVFIIYSRNTDSCQTCPPSLHPILEGSSIHSTHHQWGPGLHKRLQEVPRSGVLALPPGRGPGWTIQPRNQERDKLPLEIKPRAEERQRQARGRKETGKLSSTRGMIEAW